MAKCKKKCLKRNTKIELICATPNNQSSISYDFLILNKTYSIEHTVYGYIKTFPESPFSGLNNLSQPPTHMVNIRFESQVYNFLDLTKEAIIDDNIYKIVSFHNVDEENRYIEINLRKQGNKNLKRIEHVEN